MKPKHKSQAGTFESSDILILIEPIPNGEKNQLEVSSTVSNQFIELIKKDINNVIMQHNLTGAHVIARDKGALSPTIKARVETAIKRAFGTQKGTIAL